MSRKRFFGAWLLLAAGMTANGIAREKAFVPLLGRRPADVASAASGVSLIYGVSNRALLGASVGKWEAARIGLLWAGMAVAFDFVVGHYVDGKSWNALLGEYALWRGKLWPTVLASVVVAPVLSVRAIRRPSDVSTNPETHHVAQGLA
jgi:hypothetical protein